MTASGDGDVLWSRRVGHRRHRLVLWRDGVARTLPIARSSQPFVPRIARVRGDAAVTYLRCRGDRCRPFLLDLDRLRERPLRPRSPRGCSVRDAAVWNDVVAFALAVTHACPPRARGLWLARRGRHGRRLSRFGELGALRAGRLVFTSFGRVRLATPHGRVRTLDRTSRLAFDLASPTIDGRYAYWSELRFEGAALVRVPLKAGGSCDETWPRRGAEITQRTAVPTGRRSAPDFAVGGGRLFYATEVGAFTVERGRAQWHRDCRSSTPTPTPTPTPTAVP